MQPAASPSAASPPAGAKPTGYPVSPKVRAAAGRTHQPTVASQASPPPPDAKEAEERRTEQKAKKANELSDHVSFGVCADENRRAQVLESIREERMCVDVCVGSWWTGIWKRHCAPASDYVEAGDALHEPACGFMTRRPSCLYSPKVLGGAARQARREGPPGHQGRGCGREGSRAARGAEGGCGGEPTCFASHPVWCPLYGAQVEVPFALSLSAV